jgi:hypothetical protein
VAAGVCEGVSVSEFVLGTREDGERVAGRVPLTLTLVAHASRLTLVATAHATAHAFRGTQAVFLGFLQLPDKLWLV